MDIVFVSPSVSGGGVVRRATRFWYCSNSFRALYQPPFYIIILRSRPALERPERESRVTHHARAHEKSTVLCFLFFSFRVVSVFTKREQRAKHACSASERQRCRSRAAHRRLRLGKRGGVCRRAHGVAVNIEERRKKPKKKNEQQRGRL